MIFQQAMLDCQSRGYVLSEVHGILKVVPKRLLTWFTSPIIRVNGNLTIVYGLLDIDGRILGIYIIYIVGY